MPNEETQQLQHQKELLARLKLEQTLIKLVHFQTFVFHLIAKLVSLSVSVTVSVSAFTSYIFRLIWFHFRHPRKLIYSESYVLDNFRGYN